MPWISYQKSQPICLIAEVETDMHSNIFLQELKQEVWGQSCPWHGDRGGLWKLESGSMHTFCLASHSFAPSFLTLLGHCWLHQRLSWWYHFLTTVLENTQSGATLHHWGSCLMFYYSIKCQQQSEEASFCLAHVPVSVKGLCSLKERVCCVFLYLFTFFSAHSQGQLQL